MRMHWSELQAALRARYANIGAEANVARRQSTPESFDHVTWTRLCDAGLWRIVVPAEYGGAGQGTPNDWWDFTAALEGLSSTLTGSGLILSVIAQAGMVRGLMLFGTEAQKRHYLRRILQGRLSATAIADPDTGTDVRATSSVLTLEANETYRLNGAKYNIAHAPIADFIMVVCRLAGQERSGISLVMVDADKPGLSIGATDRKLGNHDLPTAALHFDNVRLSYGDLLGVPGEGLRNLISMVSLGRLYYGLAAAMMLEPMLERAMAYAQERQTFGVAIADHQYIQRRLTDTRMRIDTARWAAWGALDQLLLGASEATLSCSTAKLVGAKAVTEGALDLVKLFGSKGYHDGEVTRFLCDALAFCSVGGTEEMHRRNIFNQMQRLSKIRDRRVINTVAAAPAQAPTDHAAPPVILPQSQTERLVG